MATPALSRLGAVRFVRSTLPHSPCRLLHPHRKGDDVIHMPVRQLGQVGTYHVGIANRLNL